MTAQKSRTKVNSMPLTKSSIVKSVSSGTGMSKAQSAQLSETVLGIIKKHPAIRRGRVDQRIWQVLCQKQEVTDRKEPCNCSSNEVESEKTRDFQMFWYFER